MKTLFFASRASLTPLFAAVCGLLFFACLTPARATEIQRVVSPGGIEAWLVEEHSIPLVSMQFAFVGGASQDDDGKEGTANMVSGLLDEGAGDYDSEAFQLRLRERAIQLSFDAGRDNFSGSIKTLSRHADEAFDLLRLALNEPRFDEEPVERIRAQIITGLRFQEQDPEDVVGKLWSRLAFPGHPYSRPVEGTKESVSEIGIDDLRAYVARVLSRGQLKIAVVGDIDAATLAPLLDEIFSTLPAEPELKEITDIEVAAGPARQIVDMDIPQTVIRFGLPGIARKDPDFIPGYIVNHILGGGGFSSRLYAEVREKRGFAYSVFTALYPLDHAAVLYGAVGTRNDRAAESLKVIQDELRRLGEEGPSEQELAAAKAYLTGSYALRFDSSRKIASELVGIQLEDLGIDYINERNGLIEAVTIEDVRRVARRLLEGDKMISAIVGRPDGLEEIRPGG
jgi:zinc protease